MLLTSLDGCATIVDLVLNESQYVRNSLENGEEEKKRIQLGASIANGRLHLLQLDSEIEFEHFLELAVRLDDGEAATLAVAVSRGGTLITDDRKALSIANELLVPTITTPDVLRRWAERSGVSSPTLCQALENIRWRARYEPGKLHPLWSWWRAAIDAGQTP